MRSKKSSFVPITSKLFRFFACLIVLLTLVNIFFFIVEDPDVLNESTDLLKIFNNSFMCGRSVTRFERSTYQQSCGTNYENDVLFNRWINDEIGILDEIHKPEEPIFSTQIGLGDLSSQSCLVFLTDDIDTFSRISMPEREIISCVKVFDYQSFFEFPNIFGVLLSEYPSIEYFVLSPGSTLVFDGNVLSLLSKLSSSRRGQAIYSGFSKSVGKQIYADIDGSIILNRESLNILSSVEFVRRMNLDYQVGVQLSVNGVNLVECAGCFPMRPEKVLELERDGLLPSPSLSGIYTPPISFGGMDEENRRTFVEIRKIPKIIHQIWIGPKETIPREVFQCKRVFEECGYEHHLWTDDNIDWIINSDLKASIEQVPNKVSDLLRWEILFKYGGFVLDSDLICLKSFEDFIESAFFYNASLFSSCEHEDFRPGLIATGVVGGIRHSLSMFLIMRSLRLSNLEEKAWVSVGPYFFTKVVNSFNLPIHVVSSKLFYPMHYKDIRSTVKRFKVERMKQTVERFGSYVLHLWGSTFFFRESPQIFQSNREDGSYMGNFRDN